MSLSFDTPFNVVVKRSENLANRRNRGVATLEKRKTNDQKHELTFFIATELLNSLWKFRLTPVFIPTLKRKESLRFLDLIPEDRPVILFVERHEDNHFMGLINGKSNYFVISLPNNWKRRGCRSVRQIMKAFAECEEFSNAFTHYIPMDDDIIGAEMKISRTIFKDVSLDQLFALLERNKAKAPIVCFQPQRNRKYHIQHWDKLKEITPTSVAEKLLIINIEQTRSVNYFPPALLDVLEGFPSVDLKKFPNAEKAFRQGEDFGLCYQLGEVSCMLRRYFLTEESVQSRNGTAKAKDTKKLHQLLLELNEAVSSSKAKAINQIDFTSILTNLEKKFGCNNTLQLQKQPPARLSRVAPTKVNFSGTTTFAALRSSGQYPAGCQFIPQRGKCKNQVVTFKSWNGSSVNVTVNGQPATVGTGVPLLHVK